MEKIIVTRHVGLIEYMIEKGIVDKNTQVVPHAGAEEIKGKHVFGVLPLRLAAEAGRVTEVPMDIPLELRGVELTVAEVELYASPPITYKVEVIK